MKELSRRAVLAGVSACAASPALAGFPTAPIRFVPWPEDIVELNRVTATIFRHAQNLQMADQWASQSEDEMAAYFQDMVRIEANRLQKMKLDHPIAHKARRRYLEDCYKTQMPSATPPFIA